MKFKMIECCVNCANYNMDFGYCYSEHTQDIGSATCVEGVFCCESDADKVVEIQRDILKNGCPFFKEYE